MPETREEILRLCLVSSVLLHGIWTRQSTRVAVRCRDNRVGEPRAD